MPTDRSLLVRCDASAEIGFGHAMRCFALSAAWRQARGRVVFACSELPEVIKARLSGAQIDFVNLGKLEVGSDEDVAATASLAQNVGADWIIADGYSFGGKYQTLLRSKFDRLAIVDDDGKLKPYHARAILNQNPHASETLYPERDRSALMLLGTKYALLRPEFLSRKDESRVHAQVARKVLVSLGGFDPHNATQRVLEAFGKKAIPGLEITVTTGRNNPHFQSLQLAAKNVPGQVKFEQDARDMPSLMAWADLAICAGGSTTLELAYMGLPSLLITLAENQVPIADALDRVGAARKLGWISDLNSDRISQAVLDLAHDQRARQAQSEVGRKMVDGRGAERVVAALAGAAP